VLALPVSVVVYDLANFPRRFRSDL